MKFGFSKCEITPKLPCKLSGFDADRQAHEIHDALYAKIIVFEWHDLIYGVVACDLLAVDHLLVDACKAYGETLGIFKENLFLCATHTHSGPCGTLDTQNGHLRIAESFLGKPDHEMIRNMASTICEGLKIACQNRKYGTIHIAHGICAGIGSNRNDRLLPGNNDIFVCELTNADGKIAVVNFACHPTVLNAENQMISADYPGALNELMQQEGYQMTMFLNGSCGDISTRFTRKGNGFSEVNRDAELLKQCILGLDKQEVKSVCDVRQKQVTVKLKAKKAMGLTTAKQQVNEAQKELEKGIEKGLVGIDKRLLENKVEAAKAKLRYASYNDGITDYDVTVSFLKINKEIFVGIPGELFSQLSNPLQDEHTHFIGYTNGYFMYFADQKAYQNHYYEAASSPFAQGEGEKLMLCIKQEIEKLRNIN